METTKWTSRQVTRVGTLSKVLATRDSELDLKVAALGLGGTSFLMAALHNSWEVMRAGVDWSLFPFGALGPSTCFPETMSCPSREEDRYPRKVQEPQDGLCRTSLEALVQLVIEILHDPVHATTLPRALE